MPEPADELLLARRRAFGKRLRSLRENRGLSQTATAAAADLARGYYSGVESGQHNISLDNLFALADTLGVDIAELFNGLDVGAHHGGKREQVDGE
ncbi:helix-turn-helix domain-containing protein [Nocardia asiatica]|uniref:helix-turn-helix domain-containing protein n=1 Tax=Nocardia asiatica TaxID=209252 RepID=UPI0007C4CAAC|nr:helix-turn-helix transcriptional regulator [Nocardia asiatica]